MLSTVVLLASSLERLATSGGLQSEERPGDLCQAVSHSHRKGLARQ
jgi:hypothetical protein